jgi:hypothetical protein
MLKVLGLSPAGAIELLVSLKKVPASVTTEISKQVKGFSDTAADLLTANQVSNADTVNATKIISRKQRNPFLNRAVWIPSVVALGLLVLANAVFVYDGVFTRSIVRMGVEVGCMVLGIALLGFAHHYRTYMEHNKVLAKEQVKIETELYAKRQQFIAKAARATHDSYKNLLAASKPINELPQAKLFSNGLNMLAGIATGLGNVEKFAKVHSDSPLFDITNYAKRAVREMQDAAKEKGVTLTGNMTGSLLSRIEPAEIEQIISSLTDNAIKFSGKGDSVEVSLYRRFNKIIIRVTDSGEGISKDKLPSLLEPFSRGTDSMEYNYAGIGLSLYTDKIIVNKLGGTIKIESVLRKGTRVTVTLPNLHDRPKLGSLSREGAVSA